MKVFFEFIEKYFINIFFFLSIVFFNLTLPVTLSFSLCSLFSFDKKGKYLSVRYIQERYIY